MFCPHCGTENNSPFAFCTSCNKAMTTLEGAAPSYAPGAPVPPPAPKTMSRLGVAGVLLALLIAGFDIAMTPVEGDAMSPGYSLGYRMGTAIFVVGLPLLLAYL